MSNRFRIIILSSACRRSMAQSLLVYRLFLVFYNGVYLLLGRPRTIYISTLNIIDDVVIRNYDHLRRGNFIYGHCFVPSTMLDYVLCSDQLRKQRLEERHDNIGTGHGH